MKVDAFHEWDLWDLKKKQNCEDFLLNRSRRNGKAYSLEIIVLAAAVKIDT